MTGLASPTVRAATRTHRRERPRPRRQPSAPRDVPGGRIGVLGLQGDFEAHARKLASLGVEAVDVRRPEALATLAGLILPGGESTTLLRLLDEYGFPGPLRDFAGRGGALFGTCAGLILLSTRVTEPEQPSLGLIDVTTERNAYGRQVDSFVGRGEFLPDPDRPLEMVFIRAPRILRVGEGVRLLATYGGEPVLVESGRVMAGAFHPELTDDPRVHVHFLRLAGVDLPGADPK